MTGPAPPAGSGLGRCFEVFTVTAFGLETLRAYAAPGEEDRMRAFRRGLPLPQRPAQDQPVAAPHRRHHGGRQILAPGPRA